MVKAIKNALKNALAEPKKIRGAPVPLFDRLVDEDCEIVNEQPVKRFYNREELIHSIEREVSNILNTRTTARREDYEDFSENNLNFGLPEMFGLGDFSRFDATNQSEWDKITRLCEETITRFEPRIKNISVTISEFDRKTQSLNLNLQADFAVKEFQGEVTFPTIFLLNGR
jgi:type VI secretion system protein ImpF